MVSASLSSLCFLFLVLPDVIQRAGGLRGRGPPAEGGSRIAARRSPDPQVLHGATSADVQLSQLTTGRVLFELGNGWGVRASLGVLIIWEEPFFPPCRRRLSPSSQLSALPQRQRLPCRLQQRQRLRGWRPRVQPSSGFASAGCVSGRCPLVDGGLRSVGRLQGPESLLVRTDAGFGLEESGWSRGWSSAGRWSSEERRGRCESVLGAGAGWLYRRIRLVCSCKTEMSKVILAWCLNS